MPSSIKSDQGSVAVLNLALTICLLSVLISLFSVCDVAVQEHKLQSSADLAALAGAQLLISAPNMACENARKSAVQNGAHLMSCEVDANNVTVKLVERTRSSLISRFAPTISQVARAGF